jgi:hypothetical protein
MTLLWLQPSAHRVAAVNSISVLISFSRAEHLLLYWPRAVGMFSAVAHAAVDLLRLTSPCFAPHPAPAGA